MREAGVIDTLMMFVDEYPRLGRVHKIALFSKGAEWVSRLMTPISIQPRPIRWKNRGHSTVAGSAVLVTRLYCANRLIHGEAANSWHSLSTHRDRCRICRALIYFCILRCVAGQNIEFCFSQQQ